MMAPIGAEEGASIRIPGQTCELVHRAQKDGGRPGEQRLVDDLNGQPLMERAAVLRAEEAEVLERRIDAVIRVVLRRNRWDDLGAAPRACLELEGVLGLVGLAELLE